MNTITESLTLPCAVDTIHGTAAKKSKRGRPRRRSTETLFTRIDPALSQALDQYVEQTKPKTTRQAITELALVKYLSEVCFWTPLTLLADLPPKPESDTKQVAIRLPMRLAKRVEDSAEALGLDTSNFLRMLIIQCLPQYEGRSTDKPAS